LQKAVLTREIIPGRSIYSYQTAYGKADPYDGPIKGHGKSKNIYVWQHMYMCILSVFQKSSYMFYEKARQTPLFAWLSVTISLTAYRFIPT
jgi:hypothetical protein